MEEVRAFNRQQDSGIVHPYTCDGEGIPECQRNSGEKDGSLTATPLGLICPCGGYVQKWGHSFSFDSTFIDQFKDHPIMGANLRKMDEEENTDISSIL